MFTTKRSLAEVLGSADKWSTPSATYATPKYSRIPAEQAGLHLVVMHQLMFTGEHPHSAFTINMLLREVFPEIGNLSQNGASYLTIMRKRAEAFHKLLEKNTLTIKLIKNGSIS